MITCSFSHILNYIRCDQKPPPAVSLDVLREAEFFCIHALIHKLEGSSPCVISLRRRESFRRLIPDYEHMKMDIIHKSTEKRSSFNESRVVITQLDHSKLKGTIPCYNCSREFVTVNHGTVRQQTWRDHCSALPFTSLCFRWFDTGSTNRTAAETNPIRYSYRYG